MIFYVDIEVTQERDRYIQLSSDTSYTRML
jgi:hypothetical protein